MPGQRQARQHADRLDYMLVDLVPIFRRQRPAADGKVVKLAAIVELVGHLDLEAQRIVGRDAVLLATFEDVVRPVGQ